LIITQLVAWQRLWSTISVFDFAFVGRCVRHEQRIHIFALPENAGAPDEEEAADEQRLAALMT
jgi:hypothetical protein